MQDFDKILESYVSQILKIQGEKQKEVLSETDLDQIASDLGLSGEEMEHINEKFAAFLIKGQGFARYKNWDKAIEELEPAVLLKPIHTEALFGLADAYRNLFLLHRKKEDKEKALYFAERCLKVSYRHEACLFLISQLSTLSPKKTKKFKTYILSLLAFFFLVTILWFWIWSPWGPSPAGRKVKKVVYVKEISQNLDLPVFLLPFKNTPSLELSTEVSFIKKTKEGFVYEFKGGLVNQTFEVSNMEISFVLKDIQGKQLLTEKKTFLSDDVPEMRPGDFLPLSFRFQIHPQSLIPKKAEIQIDKIKKLKPNGYEAQPAIPVLWENSIRQRDVNLLLYQRSQVVIPESDQFEHLLVLAMENNGKKAIQKLSGKILWFDLEEKLIHEEKIDFLSQEEPLFGKGQRRTFSYRFKIAYKSSDFAKYKLFITECSPL